jgi:2-polyprenyl-3-methyl-5-hydroxy-6-metoxy-1,4-benzoquinol methylase
VTGLDRFLQRWRVRVALSHLPPGADLLDVGCYDGVLMSSALALLEGRRPRRAVGIDPIAPEGVTGLDIRRADLTSAGLRDGEFSCVTLLAVLEHVPDAPAFARDLARVLAPGGRVIITVPSPRVDAILAVLGALRLVHGMSLEQHHGYDPRRTNAVFEGAGFRLIKHRTFQLGFNNLFVFEKR